MDRTRKRIIRRAVRLHHRIFPCRGRRRLEDCFTTMGRQLIFWFNTEDRSTHAVAGRVR